MTAEHWYVGSYGAVLLIEHGPVDDFGDGEVLPRGLPCMAVSETKSLGAEPVRCPKQGVVGISAYEQGGPFDDGTSRFDLCGGHFNVHRMGKSLRCVLR